MTGRMIEFDAKGSAAPGYLATPEGGVGPGVVVLHEWWGLTEPRDVCDKLARPASSRSLPICIAARRLTLSRKRRR